MKISISKLKLFKACRRAYFFKYVEGLEPVQTFEALETGKTYHKMIEMFYNNEEVDLDYSKESAMFAAYLKYISPKFKVAQAEQYFEYFLDTGDVLNGIIDGISDDGHIVEHKTTSQEITEQYEYNLLWDEQLLAYMLATGKRKAYYTICRKPTIRQKQTETEEEFFNRMVEWYDVDTDKKIKLLYIDRTDAEVEQFKRDLQDMCDEIQSTQNLYRNCGWCNVWGRRCEYSSICLHYDPQQQYIEFKKGDAKQ